MKKSEIVPGKKYLFKHSSGVVPILVLREVVRPSYGRWDGANRDRHHFLAKNLKTGRQIELKSAVKVIREVSEVL